MARAVKAKVVITGLFGALGAFFLVVAWRSGDAYELYIRRPARVYQDGRQLAGAQVFKGSNGHLLLTLASRRSAPLIYFPDSDEVLECNSQTFLDAVVFGLQKHSRDGGYPCAGSGKQEIKQDVTYSDGVLGFNRWDWNAHPFTICRMEIRGSNLAGDNH